MSENTTTVDLLEKDRECNSNRATVDSRKERAAMHEAKREQRNTATSELNRPARAARYARKASRHLEERVQDTDILRQMDN